MEHDTKSTSDSRCCLKRETQQTQTEISKTHTATEAPKTCDIPTSKGLIQLWTKFCDVVIGIIVFGLVFYYVESSKGAKVCAQRTARLQNLTVEHRLLKARFEKTRITLNQSETTLNGCKSKRAIELQKEKRLNEKNDDLTTSIEKCETSLSELMAASGTRNNIKLTKMEEYSHEKLAVEFREIYDEEYTNADDELRQLQNATKIKNAEKYLLNIVKLAYELCSTYATEHKRSIIESVTNIDVKTSFNTEKHNNSQETVRVSIDHLMSTLELDDIASLTLSTAIRLQGPIIKVLSQIIASRFEIEPDKQPSMMQYIRKCLEISWMMNMHSSPIFLKFEDVSDPIIFDTKTYKEYMNGGKFLDFIVWPPVYAYEGGELISKGIAERKEN